MPSDREGRRAPYDPRRERTWLKRLRGDRTLDDIASPVGLKSGYLAIIENGRSMPKVESLPRIAAAYGIDVHVLLDGLLEIRFPRGGSTKGQRRAPNLGRTNMVRDRAGVLLLTVEENPGVTVREAAAIMGDIGPSSLYRQRTKLIDEGLITMDERGGLWLSE